MTIFFADGSTCQTLYTWNLQNWIGEAALVTYFGEDVYDPPEDLNES